MLSLSKLESRLFGATADKSSSAAEPRVVTPSAPRSVEQRERSRTMLIQRVLHSFPVASGETILDASLRAELVLDFSCTTGACGTCTLHLREGAVHMEQPNCLTDDERAAGLILPCVSRPENACTLEPVS